MFAVLDGNGDGRVRMGSVFERVGGGVDEPDLVRVMSGMGLLKGDDAFAEACDVEVDYTGFVALSRAMEEEDLVEEVYNATRSDLEPWDEQPWYHARHPHLPSNTGVTDPGTRARTWRTILVSLAAGGVAGSVAKTVTAPLDRTKVLIQTGVRVGSQRPVAVWPTLREIWIREGPRGLFVGNMAQMLRVFPYSATQFVVHEQVTRIMQKRLNPDLPEGEYPPRLPAQYKLIAGALAGLASVSVSYPLDLVRARLASQVGSDKEFRSISHCLAKTFRQDGIRGLYRGLAPTLVGIAPYGAISFATFHTLRENVQDWWDPSGKSLPVALNLACGGIAGLVSQTATFPLDLARRRRQLVGTQAMAKAASSTSSASFSPKTAHMSSRALLVHIVRTEGILAIYRGIQVNFIRAVPSISISYAVFEFLKSKASLLVGD